MGRRKPGRRTIAPQLKHFALEYLKDLNARRAWMASHPTCHSHHAAEANASIALRSPKVAKWVAAVQQKRFAKLELSAENVLEELRRIAFADHGVYYDAEGNVKPLHLLTPEERAALASTETVVKNGEAGDGHVDTVYKFKQWDKVKALELLCKHLGLVTEKHDHRLHIEDKRAHEPTEALIARIELALVKARQER